MALGDIPNPEQTWVSTDGETTSTSPFPNVAGGVDAFDARHAEGIIASYVDGHVEFGTVDDLLLPPARAGLVSYLSAGSFGNMADGTKTRTWDGRLGTPTLRTVWSNESLTYHANALNTRPGIKPYDLKFTSYDDFTNFRNGASIFVVVRPNSVSTAAAFVALGNSSEGWTQKSGIALRVDSSALLRYYNSEGNYELFTRSAAVTANTVQILGAVIDGESPTRNSLYKDGVALPTYYWGKVAAPGPANRKDCMVGRSSFTGDAYWQDFNGDIGEVLIYNRALNDAEISFTTNFLKWKYGM
ncbi:MAG TPA: LamG-like jellyroll fold domain-containing protein [Armatimonadota bacterium]|nr:LamG-like jellyroll fold domain-containing protein [Armatimonadota bacterium]